MKIFVVVMVVTALWLVLGAVLSGCSSRPVGGDRRGWTGEAWLWESLDRHTRLTCDAALPASHPLARLGRSSSQSA